MCSAEDYRAKAAEYERLTRVTKSLRESRKYRKQAEMYRALALGEEPDISSATRAGANRCPTAMPRSQHHSSRNIWRATSWNIIGDVRGVMSPGRAVSILCWHRRGRPRANVIMARNAAVLRIQYR